MRPPHCVERVLEHGALEVLDGRGHRLIQAHDDLGGIEHALGCRNSPPRGGDVRRQVLRHQHRAGFGQRRHAAHLVGELPHVAGPAVQHQVLHRFLGEAQVALAAFLRVLLQVVIGKRRDLHAPLAQRRQVEADDVEAVEEVFAEAALGDQGVEIGVGGGDDADIDA